ncbi:MAG TPA: YceD family protein [Casimicrobiaceae bacterium]|nr:YceD family protein [Casimicrobiaceae bacterium]
MGTTRAQRRFDAFRLARERGSLAGSVDATTLPRLADRVIGTRAPIDWRIEGTVDAMGRLALAVLLEGSVTLECQRCLGPLELTISQRTQLLLAHDEAETARLDAESDAEVLLAATTLDPQTLIEDELVLALPYVARHPDGSCAPPALDGVN